MKHGILKNKIPHSGKQKSFRPSPKTVQDDMSKLGNPLMGDDYSPTSRQDKKVKDLHFEQ